jgi:hypothetical protein
MRFSSAVFLALSSCASAFSQTITTLAGTGEPGFSGDGGPAVQAQFNDPRFLAVDAASNVYLVDTNNIRIRKISPNGQVTTVAGTGEQSDPAKGLASKSAFLGIGGLAAAADGTLYIASASGLQKVNPAGMLSFVVTGQSVQGVAISSRGVLYLAGVTDVSLLNPNGTFKVIAGTELGDAGDGGPATRAKFYVSQTISDPAGNVYVVDKEANRVRKFAPGGVITTFAGNGNPGFAGDRGRAERAQLNRPNGMAIDVAGNAYIADTANFRVRRVGTDGVITTFAGNGGNERNGDGGPAARAQFNFPADIAVSCSGVYVTDTASVRKIALTEPLIAYNGVVDEGGKTAITPGQAFSVSGCNLATAAVSADRKQPLPEVLGNASVTINGVAAKLSSAGARQIQGVAPSGISAGSAKVVVSVNGTASAFATVTVR